MDFFDLESLLNNPRIVEIITNLTEKERKELKKITVLNFIFIAIGYIISSLLFIFIVNDMPVSIIVKWIMAFGYLSSGFIISKFCLHWILKKQKRFLISSEYAKKCRIKLDD